jgi:hypothetical protein
MTDKELLELAARAAGYKWIKIPEREEQGLIALWLIDQNDLLVHTAWNPLEDEGLALRLAAKLRLFIAPSDVDVDVFHENGRCATELWADHSKESAAWCRAIVRAAAEIGKSLSTQGAKQ